MELLGGREVDKGHQLSADELLEAVALRWTSRGHGAGLRDSEDGTVGGDGGRHDWRARRAGSFRIRNGICREDIGGASGMARSTCRLAAAGVGGVRPVGLCRRARPLERRGHNGPIRADDIQTAPAGHEAPVAARHRADVHRIVVRGGGHQFGHVQRQPLRAQRGVCGCPPEMARARHALGVTRAELLDGVLDDVTARREELCQRWLTLVSHGNL